MKERWNSPYPHTIAFRLFSKHFTELNDSYWAHVPAASTIEKKALVALGSVNEDPKKYFLIRDEDDRRLSNTYSEWKDHYHEFLNYTSGKMIIRKLDSLEIWFEKDGHRKKFSEKIFRDLVRQSGFRENTEYCDKLITGAQTEYFYSVQAIDAIVKYITDHIGSELLGYTVCKNQ